MTCPHPHLPDVDACLRCAAREAALCALLESAEEFGGYVWRVYPHDGTLTALAGRLREDAAAYRRASREGER